MPSTLWTDPKTWIEGEKVSANELTQQVSDNITWLFERNIDVAQVSGISDYTTGSSTTWETLGALRCTLNKATDASLIKATFSASAYNTVNGGYTYFDILIDNSYYASSLTSTPLTEGLRGFRQNGSSYVNSVAFEFYIRDVLKGVHEFRMVWYSSNTGGNVNVTNSIAQFSIEEYGVANVTDI